MRLFICFQRTFYVFLQELTNQRPQFLNLCPKSWNELRYMV